MPPPVVAAPTNLTATLTSGGVVSLAWSDNANNETVYNVERSTNGSAFAQWASLGANATSYNDGSPMPGTTHSYRVRAMAGSTPSAYSNVASVNVPGTPPTDWSFGDIGAVGVAGANSSSGNTIRISGSGADIWGTADAFRFVYRAVTGDGVVEAQVAQIEATDFWAKAGVMIRESLAPGSRNAFAFLTPAHHGVVAQARTATNGETTSAAGPLRNAPYWVRLRRTGTTFTASASPDGVTWTTYATFTIPMGATAYFGFAVTSHDNTRLNTSVFADPFVQ